MPNSRVETNKNQKARDEWVRNQLSHLPPGTKILDAGAGEMPYRKYCNHLNYTSQDFGEYQGDIAKEKVGLQRSNFDTSNVDIISDIIDIPVESNSFDAVLCTEVLEHLPHPEKAIEELSRVLIPGGRLILTAPFCSLTHYAPFHFSTGFSKYWYEKILGQHGLKILEFNYNGNFFEYVAQELNRTPSVTNHYTSAPSSTNLLFKIFRLPISWMLNYLSHKDQGSWELLCFGIHVLSQKEHG